jgi:hypothetical protein
MSFRNTVQKFLGSRDGQFGIIMALLSLPILAAAGLAVDYSYAVQSKNRLRAANDAAALYAAVEYRQTGSMPSQDKILAYLTTNFAASEGLAAPQIHSIKIKDYVLKLDSSVEIPMYLMGMFGHEILDIQTTSSVTIGEDTKLEFALALDTTHSMTKGAGVTASDLDPEGDLLPPAPGNPEITRIQALKVAALKFNNSILNADNLKDRSRISVVPFARYVNVGLANRHQPWLSVPDDSGPTGQQCYNNYEITGYGKCQPYTWYYDGVAVQGSWCPPIYGSKYTESCYPTGAMTWSGCVGSRDEPNNLTDPYGGVKFEGLLNTWCNSEILPLTDNATTVANHINSLWTNDYTYVPEGIMWGWRTLTKASPYTEADNSTPGHRVRKILIVMTDGENQAMADIPAAPTHHVLSPDTNVMPAAIYNADIAKANEWTGAACEAAKNDKIEIFTISFGADLSNAAKSVLEECASDKSHYFDATDAKKLVEAFETIAYRVTATYLSN